MENSLQFYPTPLKLAHKMAYPYKHKVNNILDASAGKGNLLSQFKESHSNLFAVEINPEFHYLLQAEYSLLSTDFLTYEKDRYFDLIIINPPFANGAKHFLKAWEVADKYVCCLLNAETLRNPYTLERQRLSQIVSQYGTVEYLENTYFQGLRLEELALIRVEKKESKFINLNFTADKIDFEVKSALELPAKVDNIQDYVDRRNGIIAKGRELVQLVLELRGMLGVGAYEINRLFKDLGNADPTFYNNFVTQVNSIFWQRLFKVDLFSNYFSSTQLDNFYLSMQAQASMSFSKENIFSLLDLFLGNGDTFKKELISSVFQSLTRYYHDNREAVEGWKSNSSYQLKRRVVLPNIVRMGYPGYHVEYSQEKRLADIDKAMCIVTGKRIENIDTITDTLKKAFELKIPVCNSTFFKLRYYKKGTLHLYFREEEHRNLFNRAVLGNGVPENTER